jgi:putative membrane protein
MTRSFMLPAVAALALVACGDNPANEADQRAENPTAAAETMPNQPEVIDKGQEVVAAVGGQLSAVTANTADAYVMNAALSDRFEIESSQLALQKATSPEVKAYAQRMIKEHTATTAQLKEALAAAKLNIPLPQAFDERRQGLIDNLKAASATEFDTMYLDQQTASHSEALTLQKSYMDDGENPQLKALAAKLAPMIEMHLNDAKKLDTQGVDSQAASAANKQ